MEYCTCSWFITRKWDSLYSGFISSEFAITAEIQNILYPPPPLHSPPSSMQKWDKFDCFGFFFQRYQRNIFDIYCSCVGNFVKRMLTKEIWAPHFLMCFFFVLWLYFQIFILAADPIIKTILQFSIWMKVYDICGKFIIQFLLQSSMYLM